MWGSNRRTKLGKDSGKQKERHYNINDRTMEHRTGKHFNTKANKRTEQEAAVLNHIRARRRGKISKKQMRLVRATLGKGSKRMSRQGVTRSRIRIYMRF